MPNLSPSAWAIWLKSTYSSRSRGHAGGRLHQHVALVLRVVLVVPVERRAVVVALVGRDRPAQRLADGRGVHPELADEAPAVLGVARKVTDSRRRARGAAPRRSGAGTGRARRPSCGRRPRRMLLWSLPPYGRARPVRRRGVELGDDARQDLVVEQRAGHGWPPARPSTACRGSTGSRCCRTTAPGTGDCAAARPGSAPRARPPPRSRSSSGYIAQANMKSCHTSRPRRSHSS